MIKNISIFFGLIVVALLLVGGYFLREGTSSSKYVCMNCGLEKGEYFRTLASITYRRQCDYEQTAVSRAMRLTSCSHTWMHYSFGQSYGYVLRGKMHLDGGSRAKMMIGLLRNDEHFAKELVQLPKPTVVWSNFLFAIDANPALNDSFGEWYFENRPDFSGFSNLCYEAGIIRP